jgi:soluble lytic murein transglycosylase-like protein
MLDLHRRSRPAGGNDDGNDDTMTRRTRGALQGAAAVAVLAVLVPTVAFASPDVEAIDRDLEEAQGELAGVGRSMAELEAELRAVSDQLEELDRRLGTANAELATVRADLDRVERAIAEAEATEAAALAELEAAGSELLVVQEELASTRTRLELRLISTFKHGATTSADVVIRGTVGALDLHEIAITMNAVSRMTEDDRGLVTHVTELAETQRELVASIDAARLAAIDAARQAEVERDRIAVLVARQSEVVAAIEADRSTRRAVVARLENDVEAQAALASLLRTRIAQLEARRIVAVRPPGQPDPGSPAWAGRLPVAGQPYAAMINRVGASRGVDARLLAALVWTESGFRPNVVSHAGAAGLAQLMPGTARGLGLRVDDEVDERFDPERNVDAGARYLRAQLTRFGSVELALAAYNAGPTRVANCGCVPNFTETQLYVVRVLGRFETLAG